MPRCVSFDVGICNMAYCIFDNSSVIVDWNVLNLSGKPSTSHTCQSQKRKKTKKNEVVELCSRAAKYQKAGIFFCDKHAKTHDFFVMPPPKFTSLQKKKVGELAEFYGALLPSSNPIPVTKKEILEKLVEFYKERAFEPILENRVKKASEIDLITIGRNLAERLDGVVDLSGVTNVIIENQISTLANRMKTIQGMLAQYFILKHPTSSIEFVSSANKLKSFDCDEAKNSYKQHKKDSVFFTKQQLELDPNHASWIPIFEGSKKKDDLADAFLQAIWYFRNR